MGENDRSIGVDGCGSGETSPNPGWQKLMDVFQKKDPKQGLAEFMAYASGSEIDGESFDYSIRVAAFEKVIAEKCGTPLLPHPGESLAISIMKPKTAALAFDKVYRIPLIRAEDQVPDEIAFYGATAPEVLFNGSILSMLVLESMGKSDTQLTKLINEKRLTDSSDGSCERQTWRFLCSQLDQAIGTRPTIFYHSPRNLKLEFRDGAREVLSASINDVALVNEKDLSWEQVKEFRNDTETRAKYRRFVRWVDKELQTNSTSELEDIIAIRLDNYSWAMKKHGIKATLGSISCLLDPKFLSAASAGVAAAGYAGGGWWAGLAAAGLTVGRAAVSFGTAMVDGIDESRKTDYEIAYVYDVQEKFGHR